MWEKEKQLKRHKDWSDISYTNPGRKESICAKTNGVKQFVPKLYLLWTIREISEIANGSDMVKTCETFQDKFQKKLTFRQLYDFIKFHKQYIFNRSISHWSCLCKICENAMMLCTVINKVIPNKEMKLPENLHDIVEKFLREDIDEKKDCMMGDCLRGSVTNLSLSILVDPVVRAMIVMFPMMLRVLTLI